VKSSLPRSEDCNCLALRQAARHVTQMYDQFLAPAGLRTTQYSILAKLSRLGPLSVNDLAAELVMDRTTLGRNIQPLQRDRLIELSPGGTDRRRKEIRLTHAGRDRLKAAAPALVQAQQAFETTLGEQRAASMRALLRSVVTLTGDSLPVD
jgi:DNA-binding MarR family transcriptional regulator